MRPGYFPMKINKVRMKLYFLILTTIFINISHAQSIEQVDFSLLENEINSKSDTVKIINFWATSCKPCIEEFPYFMMAIEEYKNQKVKFIFISLDFSKQMGKVENFIFKKGLKGKHYLLKDDPNEWIDKVDKNWGGEIPYTLLISQDGNQITHDSKFNSFDELNRFIRGNSR